MRVCLGVVLGALLLAGCTPPIQYRYSAFTPAARPIAWDGRTAAPGHVRLEGTLASSAVNENLFPQQHDTALLIPGWTAEGSASVAISRRVEIGVRGAYAAYGWANPSAAGTMPVPGSPSSWGLGPELRAAFPLGDGQRFYLGFAANILDYQVPYAQWTLSPGCTPSPSCAQGYSLSGTQTESHLSYSVALMPSYAFGERGEYGHVFAGLTATTGFQNDGFTNQPSSGSTVNTLWPLMVASAGYGALVDDVFRVSGTLFKPLTSSSSPVDYNFGFLVTLGVDAPIFEASKAD